MKKIMLTFIICICIITSAFAGGSKEKKQDKVTITVWSWDVALKQLQEVAEKFKETHKNVEFVFEEMGTDQIYNKLSTSLATGFGIADVISLEGEVISGYVEKFPNGFLDLTKDINEEDFLDVKIAEVKFNGKINAFPWDAGPIGLFYRKDYFKQANVDPKSIKTWDDLIRAGKKIMATCKNPNSEVVKMLPLRPTKPSLYSIFASQLGISLFNENRETMIGTPLSIKAMNLYKKIYDSGVGLNYNGWDEYEGVVVNESVATIPEAVWMIGTIKDKGPSTKGKWGVLPLPQIEEGSNGNASNGGSAIAINAKTQSKEMVKEFVKFALTDIDMQANGFKKYGLYPSYIPSYDNEVFKEGDEFFSNDKIYNVFIEAGKNIPKLPVDGNQAEATDMLGSSVSQILLNNEDVDKTLNKLRENMILKFGK